MFFFGTEYLTSIFKWSYIYLWYNLFQILYQSILCYFISLSVKTACIIPIKNYHMHKRPRPNIKLQFSVNTIILGALLRHACAERDCLQNAVSIITYLKTERVIVICVEWIEQKMCIRWCIWKIKQKTAQLFTTMSLPPFIAYSVQQQRGCISLHKLWSIIL